MTYPFFPEDPAAVDRWARCEPGRSLLNLQKQLLEQLWTPLKPQRVLLIGGSNTSFLEWFTSQGHLVTALEQSSTVRQWLRTRLPPQVGLTKGAADDLPYDDNEFDTVALIHALGHCGDPGRVLEEAGRTARKNVLLLACNPYSLSGCYQAIRFWWKMRGEERPTQYSLFRLKRLLGKTCYGCSSVSWKSGLSLPAWTVRYLAHLESYRCLQCHPFGHYLALRIDLGYTYRTLQEPLLQKAPGTTPKPAHLRISFPGRVSRPEGPPEKALHDRIGQCSANGFPADGNHHAVP